MKPADQDLEWLEQFERSLLPGPVAAQSFAFQKKLLDAQRHANAQIAQIAQRQAQQLLQFCKANVPHYAKSLAEVDVNKAQIGTPEWNRIPILERAELQTRKAELRPRALPAGHRIIGPSRSSGSTGTPVEVSTTQITAMWQKSFALRAAIWMRRDFAKSLAVIRKFDPGLAEWPEGAQDDHWADVEGYPFRTGPRYALNAMGISTEQHFDWLNRKRPDYLLTYPSILAELVDLSDNADPAWKPKGVATLGEVVEDRLRDDVRRIWGLPVDDIYSAEEVGTLAIQCPSHGSYHVQTESAHLEVVDERGRPLPAGKQGRILVTALTGYATPLIRYAIGDHGVMGKACKCGRNGPVLTRILGRERNMLVTAKGKYWPSFGTRSFRDVAPLASMQFRQVARDRIEFRFTAERDLTEPEEGAVRALIDQSLPEPMAIDFKKVDRLDRSASGKFETFVSEIGAR